MRPHFRRSLLSAALLGGVLVSCPLTQQAPAADPPTSPAARSKLADAVGQLVTDLSSKQRAKRESARRRLLALGPDILKHLPAPDTIKSAAARTAVRRVRRTLERTAATRSAQASRVTAGNQPRLEDLVASISRQTGNRLELGTLTSKQRRQRVQLDLNRATYWQAIDSMLSLTRLNLVHQHGIGTLVPGSNRPPRGSIALSGPFRVTATSKPARSIPGSDRKLIPLRLEWMAEPRLRPLYLVCRPANFRALGRFGNDRVKPLLPRSPAATLELPFTGDDPQLKLRLDFETPSKELPRHVSLSGTADVWLAADTQAFAFPARPGAPPSVLRRAGVAVAMSSTRITSAGNSRHDARVTITVQYESGGPSFESHRLWMLYNRAHLLVPTSSKTPRRVAYDRFETPRLGDGTAQLVYHFKNIEGPRGGWRFVYEAPTQILKVAVPLDFKSWPLAAARSSD
jgi:hypothetical protein